MPNRDHCGDPNRCGRGAARCRHADSGTCCPGSWIKEDAHACEDDGGGRSGRPSGAGGLLERGRRHAERDAHHIRGLGLLGRADPEGRWRRRRCRRVHLVGRGIGEGRSGRAGEAVQAEVPRTTSSSTSRSPVARAPTPRPSWPPTCKNGNPPDSFQGHAGAELMDYIDAEQIVPVDDVIDGLGGSAVFPAEPDRPAHRGRQDLLGAVQHPPRQRGVGQPRGADEGRHHHGARRPRRLARRHAEAEGLRRADAAVTIGGTWTQVQLFETVLLADLGVDGYNGLLTKDGRLGDRQGQDGGRQVHQAASATPTPPPTATTGRPRPTWSSTARPPTT